jgi:hypothetical protein
LEEEIGFSFECLKTSIDKYDECYDNSRDAYVSFVNFAPRIKIQMQEVDKWA